MLHRVSAVVLIAWMLAGGFVVFVAVTSASHVGGWIVALVCASVGLALPALLLSDLKRTGRLRIRRVAAPDGQTRKQRPWRSIAAGLVVGCWLALGIMATWIVWSLADKTELRMIALGFTNASVLLPAMLLWGIARPHQPPALVGQRFARSPMWTLFGTLLAIVLMVIAQLIIPLCWLFLLAIPEQWARGEWLVVVLLTLAVPGLLWALLLSLLLFHAHIVASWRWRRAPFAIVSADQVWLNGLLFDRPVTPVSFSNTRLGLMLNLQPGGKWHRIPLFALAGSDEKPLLAALQ